MQTRYRTALGFLAAASLLSGSAFAFAPTFAGDLPTVIITDKLSGATPPNVYDPGNASTQYLFRYQDAFDLSSPSYVNAGPSATIGDVRFLFNEYRDLDKDGVPDGSTPEFAADHTLLIQDTSGVDHFGYATLGNEFPLTAADFTSAPTVGFLDFRNIDFSPATDYEDVTGLPFDTIGSSTPVHTIGSDAPLTASGSQFRVVELYINTDFSTEAPSSDTFLVITSVDGEDSLTSGVPGFTGIVPTPKIPASNDFSGWVLQGSGLLAGIPSSGTTFTPYPTAGNPGVFTGFSTVPVLTYPTDDPVSPDIFAQLNPNGGTTNAGTTSLTLNANTAAVGVVRFNKIAAFSAAANDLLRFRLRLQSADSSTSSKDDFTLGLGELKTGFSNDFHSTNNARAFDTLYTGPGGTVGPDTKFYNPPAGGADFDSYLITEDAQTNVTVFFNIITLDAALVPAGATGNDITATSWQVDSFDVGTNRSLLTGKNVLINRGNPTVPTPDASEQLTPESGATAFTFGAPPSAVGQTTGVGNASANSTVDAALNTSGTANALIYSVTASASPSSTLFYPSLDGFSFYQTVPELDIDHPTGGHYRVTNGKLYIADVWASSTTPTVQDLPQLRVQLNFGYVDFNIVGFFLPTFSGLTGNAAIKSAPKAYSSVNLAELGPAFTTNTVPGFITVDFQQYTAGPFNADANVTIHRITVTEYDAPTQ
ncbi:hypothetical protein IT570_07800 [Candidatus Sumerlaeota bacterium]|nr:hypothetical protein [Candidatus Sumerlaeota bacterium]